MAHKGSDAWWTRSALPDLAEVHEMPGRWYYCRSLSIKCKVVIMLVMAILRDNEFVFAAGASYSCRHITDMSCLLLISILIIFEGTHVISHHLSQNFNIHFSQQGILFLSHSSLLRFVLPKEALRCQVFLYFFG